jgi:hypothetical protein
MRLATRAILYVLLAVGLTWPTALHPIASVPGAPRGDLWDGLWSLWFPWAQLRAGGSLLRADGWLDHPDGGSLWVADPVNAALGMPLVAMLGPAATWSLLAMAHVTLSGLASHALAERVARDSGVRAHARAGWIGGVAYASAPLLLAHLHNGATEAVGMGWLALAAWALWRLGGVARARDIALAAGLLALTTVAHAYAGVCAFLLGGVLLMLGVPAPAQDSAPPQAPRPRRALALALLVGLALAAGPATLAWTVTTARDSVVGIKDARETALVRRTIGPADPVAFLAPGDFRSPDFSQISRYGEQYVHTPYLGWTLLFLGGVALARRPRVSAPWIAAGLLGALLACGPVIVRFGAPLILARKLAVPMPWFLVEDLPGLRGLTLLWRLAQLPALALAVLAPLALPEQGRLSGKAGWGVIALVLLEVRALSPARSLPFHADATPSPVLHALAAAPSGAVMSFPVTGGMAVLWEQTVHGHPLAGSLNFPNNLASRRVWKSMLASRQETPERFRARVEEAARREGIRYLLVHLDPWARPDMHDDALRALKAAYPASATAEGLRLYTLW